MENTETKYSGKFYLKYILLYTALFAVTAGGVFIWFKIYNRSLCWTTDAVSQYVPKAFYFIRKTKETLAQLLTGAPVFQMYDFALGMGDGIPLHMEPLYWLFVFFDGSHIEFAYGFILMLRFYLAGLSISAFLLYFRRGMWETLLASMMYLFSAYGLFAGMRHSHFIIPMITFPLLLIGMEEIYRKKRWYLCTLFVALSLWCGYYFTYMNTIGMGVYFLIRFFLGDREKSVKEFLLRMRTIICSYLLGIGIANITFFNTFADYLTSSRTSSSGADLGSLWIYGGKWYQNFYECFLNTCNMPADWLKLGFTAVSYMAIVVLFVRRGRRELKAAFLVGTLFCFMPVFAYIFSGFSNINNRWSYMYAFVVAVITAYTMRELLELTKRELVIVFASILPYLALGLGAFLFRYMSYATATAAAGVILLAAYVAVLVLNLWKKLPDLWKYGVMTVMTVGLLWISGMERFNIYFADMASEFTKSGKVLQKITNTPLKVMDEVEDDSFYRSSTNNIASSVQGASMVLDYNGVVYYSSTPAKGAVDFYRDMGLTSWNIGRLCGFDNRGFLDTLASVKYFAMEKGDDFPVPYGYEKQKETVRDGKTYEIYENQYALPLGYTYDTVLTADELESYPARERQEILMQTAVIEEGDAERAVSGDVQKQDAKELQFTGKEIPIEAIETEGIEFTDNQIRVLEENAKMTIRYNGLEKSETYLDIKGLTRHTDSRMKLHFNSEGYEFDYALYGEKNTYNTGQENYIFNLGYKDAAGKEVTIIFPETCKLSFDEIAVYCQPMEVLGGYVNDRREAVLEDAQVLNNTVKGTIAADEDKLLVLSILYQPGWTAYVDGEKTEIMKANLMYTGINLKAGEHTVEFRYCMPGIDISLMISAGSVIIFIVALVIRRKRKNAAQHHYSVL